MGIFSHNDEPDVIPFFIGPFYLTRPAFSVYNFLFDEDFNITGFIDWSGCHTMPMESFANPPDLIVPCSDKFLEGKTRAGDLSPQRRKEWAKEEVCFFELSGKPRDWEIRTQTNS